MKKHYITISLICLAAIAFGQKWQWSVQNLGKQYHFTSMQFVEANTGFLCGIDSTTDGGVLFKTNDAGKTWVKVRNYKLGIMDISFVTDKIGFMGSTDSGGVYYTTDGGITTFYSIVQGTILNPPGAINRIFATDSLTAFSYSEFGIIRKTINGGARWRPQRGSTNSPDQAYYDVQKLNDSTLIASASIDSINALFRRYTSYVSYHSTTDRIRTGNYANNGIGQSVRITGFHAHNMDLAIAVGFNGQIRTLKNKFRTYSKITSPVKTHLRDLNFINGKIAWAVGDEGVFITSRDSGYTWEIDTVVARSRINRIISVGETSWACGNDGKVYKSTKKEGVGLNEILFSSDNLKIYPNPTSNFIYFSSNSKINKIEIVNIQGKTMKTKWNPNSSINLAELPAGFYFARFYANNKVITKKIVLRK